MTPFYLKLRSNISLGGDIALAEREIRSFFDTVSRVDTASDINGSLSLPPECVSSNTRPKPPIGFIATGPKNELTQIACSLSFVQEIWFSVSDSAETSLHKKPFWTTRCFNGKSFACVIPFMAVAEFLATIRGTKVTVTTIESLTNFLTNGDKSVAPGILASVRRQVTSTPHVHSLHKYKAKFFPRMIRSFLVTSLPILPRNESGSVTLLDPFLGSGTALVEGTLLGYEGIGTDIDPLSCAISSAKLDLLSHMTSERIRSATHLLLSETGSLFRDMSTTETYSFPPWISRKFERWGSQADRIRYESDIASWLSRIHRVPDIMLQRLFQVCLSDALSRKFNIRMMGTGVGRFALEIASSDLNNLMEENLQRLVRTSVTCETMREVYEIKIPRMKVLKDTATNMPIPDASISIVLTSPPYLPASSGRENYLIGKSISITALGLMTPDQIKEHEIGSVGSMKANGAIGWADLPVRVKALHDWLMADPLRELKALPTVLYYQDIKKALAETYRVLIPGGLAVYVIGKESVFYRFSDREVLYRVPCDDIFVEIAQGCGFDVEERIDVELAKMNRNARPRSLDSFYETVFVLKKSK